MKNYDWLEYDSYIDCTTIQEKPILDLISLLKHSFEAQYKGEILLDDFDSIISNFKKSPKIAQRQLEKFQIL